MAELSLGHDFPPSGEAEWQALVEQALKGAPLSSLKSHSLDGIVIEPLYARASDAHPLPRRTAAGPWGVMQRVDLPDPIAANKQILEDLNNAATGLVLVFEGAIGDYGNALQPTPETIAQALEGVYLDAGVAIELDLGPACKDTTFMLANLVKARGTSPGSVNIRFGLAPLSVLAANGWNAAAWDAMGPLFAALVTELKDQGFAGPFAAGDGRPVHAAGGSEAQELAFALATAVSYLRALEAGGMDLDAARQAIYFRLAADQDQFLTIAKFRALRKLWARIEAACGLQPRPTFIAAETAWRMMTKRDPHSNIVRGTIASLAAAVGGADAITVLPFTAAIGLPDGFARRIARNTQTILIEESNLHRVADPAAGAGAIEALTDALCLAAWSLFQEIEQAGGAADALNAGLIQRQVTKVRGAREARVARREDVLTGTSDFPDLAERPASVLESSPRRQPATPPEMVVPLNRMRLAEAFEALRDASNAKLAGSGQRPKVFLACLGRPADFSARAGFAKNLFESGGIEALVPQGAQTIDDIVTSFRASGAGLACLCSSDKVYAAEAEPAAKALKAAGATHLYLAGKPRDREADLKAAGIETFLYQGCDTLAVLRAAINIKIERP